MIKLILGMIRRDCLIAYRQIAAVMFPWLFFTMMVVLFPLAVTPDTTLLSQIAAGIIWIAALLASLLNLERLFRHDYEDGTFEHYLLSPQSLAGIVLAKIIAHWLITGLPLIMIAPLLAFALHLSSPEIVVLWASLLLGTPILSFLAAITAAITVHDNNNTVLLALLIIPLSIPILILGVSSVIMQHIGAPAMPFLLLLGAMLCVCIPLAPALIAAALRS